MSIESAARAEVPLRGPDVPGRPCAFDRERAEAAVRELLLAVGEDPVVLGVVRRADQPILPGSGFDLVET